MPTAQYAFHGLLIASDVPIAARRLATSDEEPDVVVTRADALPVAEKPGWRALASRDEPFRFRVYSTGDGYVIDAQACQFHLDVGLRRLELRPRPDTPPALLPLLLIGTGLSVVMMLRGRLVLHASAVSKERAAVAMVGQTGTGKSTLAASLCSTGWELLADDALAVENSGDAWLAHPAAVELRLREGARSLAEGLIDATSYESVDGRLTVRPASRSIPVPVPLSALVFPRFTCDGSVTSVQLSQRDAAIRLLGSLRVTSWTDPALLKRLTGTVASLARQVPCLELRLPRGGAVDDELGRSMRAFFARAVQSELVPL